MAVINGVLAVGMAVMGVLTALVTFVFAVCGIVVTIMSSLRIILLAALLTFVMMPYVRYGDRAVENAVHAMTSVVYPIWIDTIRPIADVIRSALNPLTCWFNAFEWWGYGMVREVLWPTARDCGVVALFRAAAVFVKAVFTDIVVYMLSARFLTEYADFTSISPAGMALFQAWIDMYMCSCNDLGDVLRTLPIANPLILIPPLTPIMLPLTLFSQQWTDPLTWCAIESGFNAGIAAVRMLLRLVNQILNWITGNTRPGEVFERPELRTIIDQLCPALSCFARSTENAVQVFWDRYIPFTFVFTDFFCLADSLACIFLKTVGLVFRVIVNIDAAVTYPANSFWEAVVKPDVIELINLWAAPSAFDPVRVPNAPAPLRFYLTHYRLDTTAETTNLLLPNPLYGKKRIDECLCIFVTRLICDPTDASTACYSHDAQNLLMGFDFCCTSYAIGQGLANVASALFESTMHFAKGPDEFFLVIDAQPYTTVIRADIVRIARCVLAIFGLIPYVGTFIRDLLVGLIRYATGMVDLTSRVILGLGTLPYFLIAMPGVNNYLMAANVALDYFVEIHAELVYDTPDSVKNSLCGLLNNGFPVPPIPCASCVVGGFIPSAGKKRSNGVMPSKRFFDTTGKDINSPMSILRRVWGISDSDIPTNEAAYHITPLIRYDNHTANPVELYNLLYINSASFDPRVLAFPTLRSVDEFVDQKKAAMLKRWAAVKQCNRKEDEARDQLQRNPRMYEYRRKKGDFECTAPSGGGGRGFVEPYRSNNHVALYKFDNSTSKAARDERSTLAPLEPTLVGCSPSPPCFDLCCGARAGLVLVVHVAQFAARIINGLAQGGADQQGTLQDFPYFTGELANQGKPTFESDFITTILLAFQLPRCLCQVLNLIIPVIPTDTTEGRPDICCAIQRIGELIACIFQVIINAINALALGESTHYVYFRGGFFRNDVSSLFDITHAIVDCLCIFARAIFPFNYITAVTDATDFDICCGPSAVLNTLIEVGRLILQVVISIATISSDDSVGIGNAFCYWRLDKTSDPKRNCGGTLDEIGVVQQIDRILDTFFPLHAGDPNNPVSSGPGDCSTTCNMDNGQSGFVPCLCQVFYTLIPFRRFPNLPVSCSADPEVQNCPQLDLCCPFGKIGFLISDFTKFVVRMMAAAWQSWEGGLPEFLIHYIFCSEPLPAACPDMQIQYPNPCDDIVNRQIPQCEGVHPVLDSTSTIQYRCGEFTCGKFRVVLEDLVHPFYGLIAKCTCELFSLLDLLIALLYNLVSTYIPQAGWSCCFCGGQTEDGLCNARFVSACHPPGHVGAEFGLFKPSSADGGGSGILPALSYIIHAIAVALTDLMRKFPLPCYWHPVPVGTTIPTQLRQTWIFNFLAPTADALGIATGNLMCIATSTFFLPPITIKPGERFLGSIIRWVAEIIIRVVAFIEAFVQTLIASGNQCVGTKEACEGRQGAGKSTKGVNSKALGKMLVILLSIPIDILIGDSQIACTTVCPSVFAVPTPDPCNCWNLSPMYGATQGSPSYAWVADGDATGNGVCRDLSLAVLELNITQHVGTPFGTNTSGAPYPIRNPNGTIVPNSTLPAGCCQLIQPTLYVSGNVFLPAYPICQNPDDSTAPLEDDLGNPIGGATGYPGSCVVKAACRADALPSIANDPLTPIGLSINYINAIDGIVMGFVRYLRSLLDHLFTCPKVGMVCLADLQFGKIFYPLILIMSISWQILGGVIRFLAAIGIFFFSLFTPPSGSTCGCWEHDVLDPYNLTKTQYYRQGTGFGIGFCYRCRTLDLRCSTPVDVPESGIFDDPRMVFQYRCNEYCPARQILRNPGMSQDDAWAACETDYNLYAQKKLPEGNPPTAGAVNFSFNHTHVCRGIQPYNYILTEPLPAEFNRTANPGRPYTYVWPPCTDSGDGTDDTLCMCNPTASNVAGIGDSGLFIMLDFCPNPTCQNVGPGYGVTITNYPELTNIPAMWPCGGGGGKVFDITLAGPLVTCGALQIINSGLDVFHAFVEIFTTPIFVPPNKKRSGEVAGWRRILDGTMVRAPLIGPRRREPRQVFNARMRARHDPRNYATRYDGTTYGVQAPGGNVAEILVAAVYDYDTSDCYTDPVTCHCRNLDLAGHCTVDVYGNVVYGAKRKRKTRHLNGTVTERDEPMTVADMTELMSSEMFIGTSVCDHTVSSVAGKDWWNSPNVTESRRNQYVKCLDRMIQGSRLNTVNEVFPVNVMYDSQAPMSVVQNIFHGFKTEIQRRHAELQRAHTTPRQNGGRSETVRQEQDRLFPNWGQQLHERELFSRNVLIQQLRIPPTHIMFDAILKFDRIYYKYYTGYYSWSVRKLSALIATGEIAFPSTRDALVEVGASIREVQRVIWNQPYRHVVDATAVAAEHINRGMRVVMDEGPIQFIKRTYGILHERRRRAHEHNAGRNMESLKRAFRASPLYRWFGPGDSNTTSRTERIKTSFFNIPFVAHMRNFVRFQRQHWSTEPLSFWTADLHYHSFMDVWMRRFGKVVWTPAKLRNWDKLRSFAYRMQEHVWPGSVSDEDRRRFLFDGNCLLLDRTVNITVRAIDYCANELVHNLRLEHHKGARSIGAYWEQTSIERDHTYHGWRTRSRWHHERNPSSGWARPRWNLPNSTWPPLSHRVNFRIYRQARSVAQMEVHGPAGWNLYDWLISVTEDLTGYALGARSHTWFTLVQDWLTNPNTGIASWPDVGFAYWVRFPFVCNFPESVNCSIGIGLEQALIWVTVAFAAIIFVGSFIFPPATILFQIVGYPIAYFFVLMAIAYHMPPACMLLTPSFPLPFGFTIPECIFDDIIALLDKLIVQCYVPLIIPSYMVAGDPCPADPNQMIDMINCRDIGVSDGLQNMLFLGVWMLGHAFSDVVLAITSTTIGSWIPGMHPFLVTTLADFSAASGTQRQRQVFCFFATLPTIVTPAVFLFVVAISLAALVPAVITLIESIVGVFMASPAAAAVPGADADEVWFGGDDDGRPIEADQVYTDDDDTGIGHTRPRPSFVETVLYGSAARRPGLRHRLRKKVQ
jgi:hypothetical protein